MKNRIEPIPANGMLFFALLLVNTLIITDAFTENHQLSNWMFFSFPLLFIALKDLREKKVHARLNYPGIRRFGNYLHSLFLKGK